MSNPLKSEVAANLGLFLARVPLGFYFVLAGMSDVHNGGAYAPGWLPAGAAHWCLILMPWLEMLAGGMLVVGFMGRLAGMLSMVVIGLIASGTHFSLRGPMPTSYLLIGVTVLLAALGSGAISADRFLARRAKAGGHHK